MSFSDDDINEYLRRHGDVPFYVSLLARLEAAERYIEFSLRFSSDHDGENERLEAWRRSKGEKA